MGAKKKNFIVRAVTGVLFVAVLVGGMIYDAMSFALLFAVITGLSVWEFGTIVEGYHQVTVNRFISTVSGVILFLAAWGYACHLVGLVAFVPYVLTMVYLLVGELYLKRPAPLLNWAFTMMGQVYVAVPLALLNALAFRPSPESSLGVAFSGWLPLCVFMLLWANDTGAYCFGSLFGKNKLFPRISPAKSWEGSVGGGFIAVAISLVLAHFDPTMTRLQWMGFALVVVVFGTWGDLVESLIKRQIGIKDSGHILPGHGGMLDRFDSSLLAVPAVCIYVYSLALF